MSLPALARRAALALAAALHCAVAAPSEPAASLLMPGPWMQASTLCGEPQQMCDVDPRTLHWLALVAGAHRWTLEPAKPIFDEAADDVPPPPGALLLLSHPALRPGPAPTPNLRFGGSPRRFDVGTPPLRLAFNGRDYVIGVKARRIALELGDRRTEFGQANGDKPDEARIYVELLWAGDLDRDGALDVIVRTVVGGEGSDVCLYLSGAAHGPHELVGRVVCEGWSG